MQPAAGEQAVRSARQQPIGEVEIVFLGKLAVHRKGALDHFAGVFELAADHGRLDSLIFHILKDCNILVSLNLNW